MKALQLSQQVLDTLGNHIECISIIKSFSSDISMAILVDTLGYFAYLRINYAKNMHNCANYA